LYSDDLPRAEVVVRSASRAVKGLPLMNARLPWYLRRNAAWTSRLVASSAISLPHSNCE
jgi:hypothetical protein